jgi:hypothetical protein
MADYDARTRHQRDQIEAIEAPYRASLFEAKLAKLSEDAQLAHRTPKERRTAEQEGTAQETAPDVKVTEAEVTEALSKEDQSRRARLAAELRKVPKPRVLPQAMVLVNSNGPPPTTHVLARGDYANPGEEVQPGVPEILPILSMNRVERRSGRAPPLREFVQAAPKPRPASGSGELGASVLSDWRWRTELANWIASPDNPLTARVMVNRLWQHHFGRGLVSTPSDFGTRGQPPTHPELLDWLAGELARSGWSLKRMHRLILLSAAYQQSSATSPDSTTRDPENKLFARQNRVRLEGEVIRDSLLAISGRLNRQTGGPGVSPPIAADITKTAKNWTTSPAESEHHRRSLYIFARRNLRFPFLEVFDSPDSNLSCPERGGSTTAPQSLTLLNSDEAMGAAKATAERLVRDLPSTRSRIEAAYRLILGRDPTKNENALATRFLRTAPVSELCRALFNLNAFVYVE